MVGKTVIVAEKTSSTNYQTVNPGGAISSVAATEYTYSATVGSGGGGTISGAESKVVYSSGGERITGSAATFTATSSQGYTFSGWSGDTGNAAISKNKATVPNTVMSDVALVANFVEVERTVSFNANGGGVSPVSATGGVATAVTLPLPVRTGYTFLGWYTAASGGTLVGGSGNSYNPSKDITLYAHWSAISYTIAFDANGGTGSMASVAAAGGSQVTLPACTYTKDNNLFVGWNTAADGSGDSYDDEAAVLNLADEDGATVTLYAQWKAIYTITAAQVGSADVVNLSVEPEAATTIGDVAYWTQGTAVSVTVTPRAGKLLNSGGISVNGVSQGSFTNTTPSESFTFDLTVTGDTVVVPVVETQTFACSATKDAASSSAIASVSVTSANVAYGGSVTFSATPDTNFSFAGWFDAEGNFVDAGTLDGSSYKYTVSSVTEPISLVAKAAASVSLSIGSAGQAHASLSVDGTVCEHDSYSATLAVGTTISYELAIDSGWGLDAWKSGTTILPLGTSGTIYLDAALSATATIQEDSELGRTITVHALSGPTGETPLNIGDSFIVFTAAMAQQATSSSEVGGGGAQVEAEEEPGNTCTGNFVGTKMARATAQSTVETNSGTLYFFGWYEDKVEEVQGVTTTTVAGKLVSKSLALDILTNESKTYYVRYVESGTATVTVGTTNDSGELSGSAWVGDNETTAALDNVPLGSNVTIHARARNGYRFDGWYDAQNPTVFTPLSTSESFTFTVYGETAYYARFVLDRNAICEWEGSDENKTMVWRSKTYEASKPFNPSACRVDARGYRPARLLDLTVDMFSAPDADARPTAHITLSNIADQDARRLPVRRMERYMQVEVVADSEVDALLVGTSMGGLVV